MKKPAPFSKASRKPRATSVFRFGGLLALVLMAIGFAFLLIPKDEELVERLVEDGQHFRAVAVAEETSLALPIAAMEPTSVDASASAIQAVFDAAKAPETSLPAARLDALIQITDEPSEVWAFFPAETAGISGELKTRLHDSLGRRALALGKPKVAADIYVSICQELGPESDDELLRQAILACRYSGQPKRALDLMSAHLKDHNLPFSELPDDVRRSAIALNRETNNGSEAFDLLSDEFQHTLDPKVRHELVELLATTAAQSGRIPDSLPLIQQFVADTEIGKLSNFREVAGRSPDATDADFMQYGKLLATHYEWNNRADDAFNLYLKLAMMGDVEAIQRCVTIYPWISRELDVTDMLTHAVPVEGHPDYSLLLARMEASRGNLEKAAELFEAELATDEGKKDHKNWRDLAEILDEKGDFEGAIRAHRTAISLAPADEQGPSRIAMARLLSTVGETDAALLTYRSMKKDEHTHKTLEDYLLLSRSLGANEDFLTATQIKIEVAGIKPHPGVYVEIADTYRDMGRVQSEIETLNEAIDRFPESNLLRLRRIDHYTQYHGKEIAWDLIEKRGKYNDKRYAARYLSLAHELGRQTTALQNLNPRGPDAPRWSPSEWLDIASLYESSGAIDTAMNIYNRTEGGEIQLSRLLAEQSWEKGDVRTACQHQLNYTSSMTEPDHEAYTFLGDIFRALGEVESAEGAYLQALTDLQRSLGDAAPIASETAAN